MSGILHITDPSATSDQGVHRVCARVDDQSVWFESADSALDPAPEAFAGAFLIPALARSARLGMEAAVCPQWRSHLPQILQIVHDWWGYPPILPQLRPETTMPRSGRATGLCFSGGGDSFYSLLRSETPIHHLIYIHGFDIALDDTARMTAFEPGLRRVAAETGAKLTLIRTNLRRFPEFTGPRWEHTHGGALAAVGHLMRGCLDRYLISASYPYKDSHPWGSHFSLDPLWSSQSLEIEHFGATHYRSEKLQAIAEEPLVQAHLRVCWENRAAGLNCSRCEKCVRTQLALASWGKLGAFTVFDRQVALAEAVDALPRISNPNLIVVYAAFLTDELQPEVARALRRLLARSRRAVRLDRWKGPLRTLRSLARGR